jgi:hypothetical protein
MGWLSKLIVVDNLGCPKCKRNSAEFLEKKNLPSNKEDKLRFFNIDRVVQFGLLQGVSRKNYDSSTKESQNMDCIIWDMKLYLKGITMLIGYSILKIQIPQIDLSLLLKKL